MPTTAEAPTKNRTITDKQRDKLAAAPSGADSRREEIQDRYGDVGLEAYEALDRFHDKTESGALNYYYDLGKAFLAVAEKLPKGSSREEVFADIALDSISVVNVAIQMAEIFDDNDMATLVSMRSNPKGTVETGGQEVSKRLSWGIVKAVIPLNDRTKIYEALEAWKVNGFSTREMAEFITNTYGQAAGGKAGARDAGLAGAPLGKLRALNSQAVKARKVVADAKAAMAELTKRAGNFNRGTYKLVLAVEKQLSDLGTELPDTVAEVQALIEAIKEANPDVLTKKDVKAEQAAARKAKREAAKAAKLAKKKAKAAKVKPVKVKKVAKNVDDVADIDAGVDDGVEEEVVVAKPKKAVVAVGGPTGKPRREVAL